MITCSRKKIRLWQRPWESVVFKTGTTKCPSANHLDVNKTLPSELSFSSLPIRQVFHEEDFNNRLYFLTEKRFAFVKQAWPMFFSVFFFFI